MKKLKKFTAAYGIALIAVFMAVVCIGNYFANTYAALVSTFLGQETTKTIEVDDVDSIDTQYFKSKYSSQTELYQAQIDYAKEVQAEGTVLLQNVNLPMEKTGNITILGSGSAKDAFLVGGGGSGSIDTAKTPTLKELFESAGYSVNSVMWDFYTTGAGKSTRGNETVGEAPVNSYTEKELNSFAEFNDAAIVVIGRLGGETRDVATTTTEDPEKSMLELSQNELDLIDLATEKFDRVVVLLNTLNAMELEPLTEKNVSVLWIGAGGQQGLQALPGILNGTYNPSGHLVDTYVYNNFSSPAMVNFGDYNYANYNEGFGSQKYLIYQEGIYVGYKYYETRYEDSVLGTGNAGNYEYDKEVLYPFGYGMSYTDFEYSDYSVSDEKDHYTAKITVTNTGGVSGRDAVQIYLQKPYTEYDKENKVEKASVELAGFAKTSELEPGSSEEITIEIPKEYLRTYDAYGTGSYLVEAGTYYLSAGTDAHDALNNILAAKGMTAADGMTEDGDSSFAFAAELDETTADQLTNTYNVGEDGVKIENQLSDIEIQNVDQDLQYLSRSDWEGTLPTDNQSLEASDELVEMMKDSFPNIGDAEMPTTGASNDMSLVDVRGLPYDAPEWDDLLDQMTVTEMQTLICNGAYGSVEIASINKNKVLDKDGPAGISATLIGGKGTFGYPTETLLASTWNVELAEQMGELVGEDGLLAKVSGWYAPAMNIHRTPFSGRNFEYYSEDSMISGVLSAAVTKAAQEMGLYTFSKHFALNDQELNRNSVCVFSSEQAAREIYLRPFEVNVRSGGSHGIMVSMNRVGAVWSGSHKGMTTNILKNEWGFEGCVVTDASSIGSTQKGLYGGTDMWLGNGNGSFQEGFESDAGVVTMMRNACHNILYAIVNSNAMNGIASGTQIIPITPVWQIALYIADAVLAVICLGGIVLLAYNGFIKKTDNKEEVEKEGAKHDEK